MRKVLRSKIVTWAGLLLIVAGCAEVPITGRRQLSLVPESLVTSMSLEQYNQFLAESKLSADVQATAMVRNVGNRIVQAIDQFYRERGEANPVADYKWEFNLIADKTVNAWAMPGGKVVFYEGIIPVAQNEAGIATVMGHEIAHVVAGHGSERMSQALLVQMGGMALSTALSQRPEATQQLFMTAYGLGGQIGVLLPYSRLHENEADRLGMIFMAMAGYHPQEAASFWQRMSAVKGAGAQPPEFLSTHPADATRIRNLQELIPEAMEYYRPAGGQKQAPSAAQTILPPAIK
ncbi:MAG: M48 family metallopeptidase [Planctomycetes bacterium]|nr:M48 family metallopeptidase [Planctomycetota bacterium]